MNDEPQNDAPQEEEPQQPEEQRGPEEDATPIEPPPGPTESEEQPEAAPHQEPAEEAPAEPDPAPEKTEDKAEGADAPKAKDLPPGAELDPIAISEEGELSAEERARREAEAEERARAEAEAVGEVREEPVAAVVEVAEIAKDARYSATGKRKNSVARVIVKPGGGAIVVNGRPLEEYFPRPQLQTIAKQALVTSGYEGTVDVQVRAHGGGISGQAAAVRHGIARALVEIDPNLRGELKKRGLLTRDARVKERRKAGLKKARKKPQFSKR